ncbi:MAG: signal peptidase II [Agathobacter sp.]|nr:signal peptidase II [Agathobacter sp.]
MGTKSKKTICISAILVVVLVALDQITKQLAVTFLKGKDAFPIIKDVFELKYLENQSAAFGMDPISLLHKIFSFEAFNDNPELFLNVKMIFFIILTIAILAFFCFMFIKIPDEKRFKFMDYILIFFSAGAIGNFIDRVSLNYVVDFFYFKLIDFPIFNVADIYVTCSAFFLLFLGIFYYKDEDLDKIFPPKSKEDKK